MSRNVIRSPLQYLKQKVGGHVGSQIAVYLLYPSGGGSLPVNHL